MGCLAYGGYDSTNSPQHDAAPVLQRAQRVPADCNVRPAEREQLRHRGSGVRAQVETAQLGRAGQGVGEALTTLGGRALAPDRHHFPSFVSWAGCGVVTHAMHPKAQSVQAVVILFLVGIRVAEGAQALAWAGGLDVEQVAAQEVDVPVLEGERRATSSSLRSWPSARSWATAASRYRVFQSVSGANSERVLFAQVEHLRTHLQVTVPDRDFEGDKRSGSLAGTLFAWMLERQRF